MINREAALFFLNLSLSVMPNARVTVDLTGDPTPSQVERDGWVADEEHEAQDIVISSQDGNDEHIATFQLYGVVQTKIVGVQYYRGLANSGEYVVIRREPGNQVGPLHKLWCTTDKFVV